MTTSADLPAQEPSDEGQAPDRRHGLQRLVERLDAARDELAGIKTALQTYIPPEEREWGQDNDEEIRPDRDPPEGDDD